MHDTNTESQKLEAVVEVKRQTIRDGYVRRQNEREMKSYPDYTQHGPL